MNLLYSTFSEHTGAEDMLLGQQQYTNCNTELQLPAPSRLLSHLSLSIC